MRNGFTKIPNSLDDLPLSIAEIGIYTWLSIHADKNGNVSLSLNDITRMTGLNKMQVRRFLEKLKANKLLTQQVTHKATHLPSVTTICYLSSYKKGKTELDTATDTATDTLRAYKNDIFYNQSIEEEKEKRNNLSNDKFKEKFGNYDFSFVAEDMAETFFRWLSYRKELKKPFNTQSSLKQNYDKLMKLANNSPEQARLIVEQSIANQWQGLFHIIEEQKKGSYSVGQILRDNSSEKYLKDAKWK